MQRYIQVGDETIDLVALLEEAKYRSSELCSWDVDQACSGQDEYDFIDADKEFQRKADLVLEQLS